MSATSGVRCLQHQFQSGEPLTHQAVSCTMHSSSKHMTDVESDEKVRKNQISYLLRESVQLFQ